MSRSTPMSQEDRSKLATKLDEDLEKFINTLPKRQQTDDTPSFENWEEELQRHPCFLKEPPKPGDKVHPLFEGLQQLKYDPDENEPLELANAYKDDGNFNFKHHNYRMAVISYSEGIKAKCGDPQTDAILHNNRAAAHFYLKNYRSSLVDCELALKAKPDYDKAIMRAANCCRHLERYDRALEYCDIILNKDKDNKEMFELRKICVTENKNKERNERRRRGVEKQIVNSRNELLNEVKNRGLRVEGGCELSRLEPQFPELFSSVVYLNDEKQLVWPVVFFYPEYKIMDYIQHFNEHNTFLEQLSSVFSEFPQWDKEKKYRCDHLNVYFEDEKGRNVKVDVNKTLLEILKLEKYVIKEGTPRFNVLVAGSRVEQQFLKID